MTVRCVKSRMVAMPRVTRYPRGPSVRFGVARLPRVTAQHEQEVRSRIVRAANDVFGSLGYHRATMRDVVAASGLSVGAIYTFFGSKDELFLACCDFTAEEVGGA